MALYDQMAEDDETGVCVVNNEIEFLEKFSNIGFFILES
jgi:hypothetical protein